MKGAEGVAYHKQCIRTCQVVSGIFEILVASKNSGPVFMQGVSCYQVPLLHLRGGQLAGCPAQCPAQWVASLLAALSSFLSSFNSCSSLPVAILGSSEDVSDLRLTSMGGQLAGCPVQLLVWFYQLPFPACNHRSDGSSASESVSRSLGKSTLSSQPLATSLSDCD